MKKAKIVCVLALAAALLLAGCSGFTYSFSTWGDDTTIEVTDAKDGDTAESSPVSVGKGREAVVESSLEKGKLRVDFAEASIYRFDDEERVEVGDVVAGVTVGPGDKMTVALEPGDYVIQVTAIGETAGKLTVNMEKTAG